MHVIRKDEALALLKDDQGRFLLAGSKYIGLNREFAIYSKYVSFNIAVTGIDKAP